MGNRQKIIKKFIQNLLIGARVEKDCTLQRAGVLLGVDPALLSEYENGTKSPSCSELMRILNTYEMDLETLSFVFEHLYRELVLNGKKEDG